MACKERVRLILQDDVSESEKFGIEKNVSHCRGMVPNWFLSGADPGGMGSPF